jgi:hypothetical protein
VAEALATLVEVATGEKAAASEKEAEEESSEVPVSKKCKRNRKSTKEYRCRHGVCNHEGNRRATYTTQCNLNNHEKRAFASHSCCSIDGDRCEFGSTIPLEFPKKVKLLHCGHTGCTKTFSHYSSKSRHEYEDKIHKRECEEACQRCKEITVHKHNKEIEGKKEKQECKLCVTQHPPLPQKLKDTNIDFGLTQLHQQLQENPEKTFNYPTTHTFLLLSETTSCFVIQVPKPDVIGVSINVIPIEALTREYEAFLKELNKKTTLQYIQGKYFELVFVRNLVN